MPAFAPGKELIGPKVDHNLSKRICGGAVAATTGFGHHVAPATIPTAVNSTSAPGSGTGAAVCGEDSPKIEEAYAPTAKLEPASKAEEFDRQSDRCEPTGLKL